MAERQRRKRWIGGFFRDSPSWEKEAGPAVQPTEFQATAADERFIGAYRLSRLTFVSPVQPAVPGLPSAIAPQGEGMAAFGDHFIT